MNSWKRKEEETKKNNKESSVPLRTSSFKDVSFEFFVKFFEFFKHIQSDWAISAAMSALLMDSFHGDFTVQVKREASTSDDVLAASTGLGKNGDGRVSIPVDIL